MATEESGWDDHYRDEKDAAFLYRQLAAAERQEPRRRLFEQLADVEDRHVAKWAELFKLRQRPLPPHHPSWRIRMLALAARWLGPSTVLPIVVAEEGREVQAYLQLAHRSSPPARATALTIATESAAHAQELARVLGREGEPWHATSSSGYMRSIVYGFNDGLTANFGLVAGVLGASVQPHVVIITGVAGAIADALSMGASGYLAAKSEAEMSAHQIAMERDELRLMPDIEEEELALIYQAKGMPVDRARETANALMKNPETALDAKVREELNIRQADLPPLADGGVTGTATAVGAFIPILPFLLLSDSIAVWVSLSVSMLAHFGIGAARSMFTGRGVWASGRDMFLVGFGVAGVGYVIGEALTRFF
jgi:VIT1/CCC1 family predicted Fe2+/Mn2+ transporter/rubrerythrin